MKNLSLVSVLILSLFCSCDKNKSLIEKDIKNRYVKFEILEIKPDSTNIRTAFEIFQSLRIKVSEYQVSTHEIRTALENGINPLENYNKLKAILDELVASMDNFEKSVYNKPDKCFYVKYTIPEGNNKITMEEYYWINPQTSDVMSRPLNRDQYLRQLKYDELVEKVLSYRSKLLDLGIQHKIY